MKHSDISQSVKKVDSDDKASGKSRYTADIKIDGMLYGMLVRSPLAAGKIESIDIPELPDGYYKVSASDIPGPNVVKIITDDQPIFADAEVNYIGEPILMLVGKERATLKELAAKIKITIKETESCLSLDDAISMRDTQTMVSYRFGQSDEKMRAIEKEASAVVEESFSSGYQEQTYLETQAVIGEYSKEEGVTLRGSIQCPYYVKNALISAMGEPEDRVRVIQETTGGAFGGKEEFPSMMSCHAALAAKVSGSPVFFTFDRDEDMLYTTKRHPSKIYYRTSLDKDGAILGIKIVLYLDAGANEGLSSVVLQRALINCIGVYKIPNVSVEGYVLKTNTVPNGAFRGFGAPQGIAGFESHMNHLAAKAGIDSLEYRKRYLVVKGDPTVTGGCFRDEVLMHEMLHDMLKKNNYAERKKSNKAYNEKSARYKKGLGVSLFLHGCGFTGSGERDHIKAVVKIEKDANDKVFIRIANVDMGQGLATTMRKIASFALEIDYDKIEFPHPDTKYVPDSGPTVASRTTMIVGRLVEKAALALKEKWQPGLQQSIEEHYVHIDLIPWDAEKFCGDAYPAYSWGVNLVEVTVDTATGLVSLERVDSAFDVGKAIDDRIVKGQIDGGISQGMAYGYLEKMETKGGKIMQKSISDYAPPGAMDSVRVETRLYDNPFYNGPYGAKGVGELTLIGGAPAVKEAIEDALSCELHKIPVTPEYIIEELGKKKREEVAS